MDFSKARPEGLVDVPALQHEIVEVTVAVPGSRQGWGGFVVESGQQVGVRELLVRPDAGKVQDFPQENSVGPDI